MSKPLRALSAAALAIASVNAKDLVIAENGKCDYQIVIPDNSESEIVAQWLLMTARLTEAAFEKNGFEVEVVKESETGEGKPGVYLGATEFAQKHGVNVNRSDDWTYRVKVVGDDVVIIGNDRKDPVKTIRRLDTPLALLGTVKGACDFLREHVGVRFLFVNMTQSHYASRGDGMGTFNEDGSLKIDTRSIAFTPVKTVTVTRELDRTKTPMMRANYDAGYETFYYIANNFFPLTSFVDWGRICWYEVIPAEKYAKSNPEYFALNKDGKRACDLKLPHPHHMQYCVTSQGVQDLMVEAAEKLIESGATTMGISAMDSYRLCRCNCDECDTFFGMEAENWEQVRARGKSGRLWQGFFKITDRIREKHPDVKIIVLNYQDTPISADIIQRFPDNVIPRIQFASQRQFDRLKGVEFPAGVCGFEETFTGFGQAGPYLPERTPKHMAEFVRTLERNNVKWSKRDGSIGYVRGMQAPAYYVYGRMMDDPSADWQAIHDEFCDAAFGRAARPMKRFFEFLHTQIAIYSDFFGVMMPAWNREYSRSKFHDSKWHVMSMYTPEYLAEAENLLAWAERVGSDPDVKPRLHLIRIEFDYIGQLSRIFYLQNAYTMNPSKVNLDPLIDAIDEWHAFLLGLTTNGKEIKPLSDWPEMRPFNGHVHPHAALADTRYQQQWKDTCLNWDTEAIRDGILEPERELEVPNVDVAPGIDSEAWDDAPAEVLKERGDMPFANVKTTMKVLRDQDALYVLVNCLYPSKHPEDLFEKGSDGNIFKDEHVELGISPPDSGGNVYRIATNPIDDSRFDSIIKPGPKNRTTEDKAWNGTWEFAYRINTEKGRWNQAGRIWTAWFRIPFADFGVKTPAEGRSWGFNVGRDRRPQYMIWKDGRNATDPNALGKLVF
ncbi:MAG: DUF4838 domain-containing protein [Lentisphaerae bacterium]|nr:DUF4838 domain-containing protein [Lentisphaerota bacterium]MBT7059818.1 DUF4838 domain-containing protein [Lentisphaerota bacterium]MBT7847339.1 DUF4838 domain-containing protein [Lentisphaerota bacterium]